LKKALPLLEKFATKAGVCVAKPGVLATKGVHAPESRIMQLQYVVTGSHRGRKTVRQKKL
jgi:hypothetical protein